MVLSSHVRPDSGRTTWGSVKHSLLESIIKGFCNDTAPQNFIKGGCAVCGTLSSIDDMVLLNRMNGDLNLISPDGIGRYERLHETDTIMLLNRPILAENCDDVCY